MPAVCIGLLLPFCHAVDASAPPAPYSALYSADDMPTSVVLAEGVAPDVGCELFTETMPLTLLNQPRGILFTLPLVFAFGLTGHFKSGELAILVPIGLFTGVVGRDVESWCFTKGGSPLEEVSPNVRAILEVSDLLSPTD